MNTPDRIKRKVSRSSCDHANGANENIPSLRRLAKTAPQQQRIRFPCCNLTAGKLDWSFNGSSHFFAIQHHTKELRPGSVHIGPLWEFDLYGVSLQIVNGFALWFAGSLRSDSFVPTFAPYRWMRLRLKSLQRANRGGIRREAEILCLGISRDNIYWQTTVACGIA